jgi:hypothetical protein
MNNGPSGPSALLTMVVYAALAADDANSAPRAMQIMECAFMVIPSPGKEPE